MAAIFRSKCITSNSYTIISNTESFYPETRYKSFLTLLSTLPTVRFIAEEGIKQLELNTVQFPQILLSIASGSFGVLEAHVRMAAALLFKNFCKRYWPMEGTMQSLTEEDRVAIKQSIVDYITRVPNNIQNQLCEAVTIIAAIDFPADWPEFLAQLVSRMNAADFDNNIAILKIIGRSFKHYQTAFRSDELYTEINYVLSQLAAPLLEMYRAVDVLIEANANNVQSLEKLLTMQLYMNKIFYSLSSQDLPAFFEDHLTEFMTFLRKQFLYNNPTLTAALSKSEDESSVLEKVPTSVARIAILYATRYEDDFTMLQQFVEAAWSVLTSVSRHPKDDDLASSCMRLLSSEAKQERHKTIFANVLQLLCDKVIVPNVLIRDSDLETFEDEPIEYIRRDLEGSIDEEGRRSGAISLARGLMEFYETEITSILMNYIEDFLKLYTSAPSQKWRDKNAAVHLFAAVAVKGMVSSLGVTRVNALVNIQEFYQKNIFPDLQPTNSALHPLLKVDAIRFLIDFRGQLEKERLLLAMPLLQHHLGSHSTVIHTFAAVAVERILGVKIQNIPMFTLADVASHVDPMINSILKAIGHHKAAEKVSENDFLIRALLRLMLTAQRDGLIPIMDIPLSSISNLIGIISKNPSNPVFTHGLFECAAALVKFCNGIPQGAAKIEATLIPVLQSILQENVTELLHYVFQLFSIILENKADMGIPSSLRIIVAPMLQPAAWSSSENIPALARFLQAAISREPLYFVQQGLLTTIFGVFQTLISSKFYDIHAFLLLITVAQSIPFTAWENFLSGSLVLILKRLQSQRNPRLASQLLLFMAAFVYQGVVSQPTSYLIRLFDGLQPGLLSSVMISTLLPQATKIRDRHDRKLVLLGLTKMATECPELPLQDPPQLFPSLISSLCMMCTTLPAGGLGDAGAEEVTTLPATGEDDFNSSWRLRIAPPPRKCIQIEAISDATIVFINSFSALSRSLPAGHLAQLLTGSNGIDAPSQQALSSLLQKYNVSI